MKKTVQINIAGILFSIEEDAYDKLSTYLKSIQNYFSAFESADEIVADIESRIAERFLAGREADSIIVSTADVEAVMARMGGVEDFEAMEEEVDFREEATSEASIDSAFEPKTEGEAPKRLFRDTRRKALGGVLSGLAHYFQFDVTWLRVIFLLLFIGLSPITETGISGILFVAYIICWIAFPPNDQLKDNSKIKKFYRNPDQKVIAGVSSGLSAYFKIDIALVRVLFVLFSFAAGLGIIAYLVLWIGAPTADSLTKKMEMKGEPVTLENIENSIRKSQGIKSEKEENTITKILLFPFRLISMIFAGLGNLLRHLGPVARVVAGLFLSVIGLSMLFSAIAVTAVFFGITSNNDLFDLGSNAGKLFAEIPSTGGIFLFLATAFPGLAATLGGFSLVSNNRVGSRNFWLTALALWVIGIFGLAIYGGTYSMNYAKRDAIEENVIFQTSGSELYFDTNKTDKFDDFSFDVRLNFEESTNGKVEVIKRYEARGRSKQNARENASTIIYKIAQKGDTLVFDDNLTIAEETPFRNQELRVNVKVPKGLKFKLSQDFIDRLMSQERSMSYKYGLSRSKLAEITYFINDDGELGCVDCPELSDSERKAIDRDYDEDIDIEDRDFQQHGSNRKTFNFKDFSGVELSGSFQAIISQGDTYSIEVVADRERDLRDVDVDQDGSIISFEFEDNFFKDRDRVVAFITMPDIDNLDLTGASKVKLLNFETKGSLDIRLSGASHAAIDVEVNRLDLNANGASKVVLMGKVQDIKMGVSGASRVDARKCEIINADVEANGASKVSLGRVEKLDSDTSGASRVSRD